MISLIQIPFSHNCIKVRRALELKGLQYEAVDIPPMDRRMVFASSGQRLVPTIEDGDRRIHESSAILRYLEEAYPSPSLLPDDEARRDECWLLEDWADLAFMEATRRMAYWNAVSTPGLIESLWFPEARGVTRWLFARQARRVLRQRFRLSARRNARDEADVPRAARLALARLGGRARLFEERLTVADVALAAMSAPLRAAAPHVGRDAAVRQLLDWGETVLGREIVKLYVPPGREGDVVGP